MTNEERYDAMRDEIIDLKNIINRQQAIIEKSEKVEYIADKTIATLQAENERLKEKQEKCFYCTEQANKKISEIKAEAYKEFAQKVIEKVEKARQKYQRLCAEQGDKEDEAMNIHFRGMINIVKEMVGE